MSGWRLSSKNPNNYVLRDGAFCATVGLSDEAGFSWWWVLYHGSERLDGGSDFDTDDEAQDAAEQAIDEYTAAFALGRD